MKSRCPPPLSILPFLPLLGVIHFHFTVIIVFNPVKYKTKFSSPSSVDPSPFSNVPGHQLTRGEEFTVSALTLQTVMATQDNILTTEGRGEKLKSSHIMSIDSEVDYGMRENSPISPLILFSKLIILL